MCLYKPRWLETHRPHSVWAQPHWLEIREDTVFTFGEQTYQGPGAIHVGCHVWAPLLSDWDPLVNSVTDRPSFVLARKHSHLNWERFVRYSPKAEGFSEVLRDEWCICCVFKSGFWCVSGNPWWQCTVSYPWLIKAFLNGTLMSLSFYFHFLQCLILFAFNMSLPFYSTSTDLGLIFTLWADSYKKSDVFIVACTWRRCCPHVTNQMDWSSRKVAAAGPHALRWSFFYPGIVLEWSTLMPGTKEWMEGGRDGGVSWRELIPRWMDIWGASRVQNKLLHRGPRLQT